jgi:hypothetical protein
MRKPPLPLQAARQPTRIVLAFATFRGAIDVEA